MHADSPSIFHLYASSSTRRAGILLLVTAVATVIAVSARVAADADQSTLRASLNAIANHRFLYGTGGIARMVAGITLGAAAWLLMNPGIIRTRSEFPWVSVMFMSAGAFTALSGACAIVMAMALPAELNVPGAIWQTVAASRAISGKIGFAVTGLSILGAAIHQWQVRDLWKGLAPVSVLLGMVMQFIWFDAATQFHRYTGLLFLLWLLSTGSLLLTGRVERHAIAMRNAISAGPRT